MTTNYNEKLAQETSKVRDKVKRGMLPLIARCPALDKITVEYAVAQAEHYDNKRSEGVNMPIAYRNSDLLDRCADLVLHEELTWSHPDKMSIVEYPLVGERNEKSYRDKHTPKSELQFGDMRYLGKRKVAMDDEDSAAVYKRKIVRQNDPIIEQVDAHIDLYRAIDNAGLTDRQRQAIDLLYFGGMTQEEAAAEMGVSQPAIFKFERIALRKLNEYMTKV